jgi:ABC-type lipoprotein release transport system permease subunit
MGLVLSIAPIWWLTTSGFPMGDLGMTGLLFGNKIYGYLTLENTLTLTLTAIIITLLAALYPALLAARMEPVEALHQGV